MNEADWYSPQECTQYDPEHIRYIILCLSDYMGDSWPPEPSSSTEVKGSGHSSGNGYFVPVSEVIGELNARIARCGKAGEQLVEQTKDRTSRSPYTYEARRAMEYCRGRRRKRQTFQQWLSVKECRDRQKVFGADYHFMGLDNHSKV